MPTSPDKRMRISYNGNACLPRHVVLSDFGNKELNFDINILKINKIILCLEQSDTIDSNPVTVKTLTPVGGLHYTIPWKSIKRLCWRN